MKRVPDLVEAVGLGEAQVARRLVKCVFLEEEPDLVPGVQEVVVPCLEIWRLGARFSWKKNRIQNGIEPGIQLYMKFYSLKSSSNAVGRGVLLKNTFGCHFRCHFRSGKHPASCRLFQKMS